MSSRFMAAWASRVAALVAVGRPTDDEGDLGIAPQVADLPARAVGVEEELEVV
jgi:hypothetical protein